MNACRLRLIRSWPHAVGLSAVLLCLALFPPFESGGAPTAQAEAEPVTAPHPAAAAAGAWFAAGPLRLDVQVKGLMRSPSDAVVLLAVRGEPARPYRIGRESDSGILVTGVDHEAVTLRFRGVEQRVPVPRRVPVAHPGLKRLE